MKKQKKLIKELSKIQKEWNLFSKDEPRPNSIYEDSKFLFMKTQLASIRVSINKLKKQ